VTATIDALPKGPPKLDDAAIERRNRLGKLDVKLSPYLYIAPFFILFAATGLFPLLYTAFVATRNWNTITGDGGSVGMANFTWALNQPMFWTALRNTFSIFLLSTVPQIIVALILAAILDSNLKAKTFWRMGVLLPYVIAPSAAAIIFSGVFADGMGVINTVINAIGIDPIRFHASTFWSHIAIASIVNFRWIGYNTLILLAAMQAIPRDVFEASVVDGAGRFRQFFSVTIPLLRPTLIFVIITSTIGGLQIFDEPRMFSEGSNIGGSNNQFMTVSLMLWNQGFNNVSIGQPNLGRAAAIAWFLFIIVVIIAVLNFVLTSRISSASGAPKPKKSKKGAVK
jgi:cellobiose transport system permease protein